MIFSLGEPRSNFNRKESCCQDFEPQASIVANVNDYFAPGSAVKGIIIRTVALQINRLHAERRALFRLSSNLHYTDILHRPRAPLPRRGRY